MERWGFAAVLCGALVVLTAVWLVLFARARGRGERAGRGLRALGALGGLAYAVMLLELAFGLFVVKSDGYGITRAGYRWFQVHWRPINSLGYRDVEPKEDGRKALLVVGDSLMAGHGTARLEERFAAHLGRALGPEWQVPVAAMCGWNTGDEITAVQAWPHRVDQVLVTYTLTDIETAANDVGLARPDPAITPPPAPFQRVVATSHLFNWVYWRWLRADFGTRYPDFLDGLYRDPAVWAAHEVRLQALVEACRAKGAEVRFVLWPDHPRVEACAGPFQQVARFLGSLGVPVLDLTERFRGTDPTAIINNALDEHPNVATQAEVAQWVAAWLTE